MASGQRQRVLEGFYAWPEGGGREVLSRLAKAREWRKRFNQFRQDLMKTESLSIGFDFR